ncbi:unannotated protein [freshwater metagenome]|uniref:Unannotated protein n=1 Tax=freshwater metagenome TaxID=449393 RepID=A0A6J7HK72_9ZZZZ
MPCTNGIEGRTHEATSVVPKSNAGERTMPQNAPTSTSDLPQEAALPADAATPAESVEAAALVEGDLLVEDVSIDGMCGVY